MTTPAKTQNPMVDPSPLEPSADAALDLNLWALKPWWCQPWSILLTGTGVVAASWLLLGRWWISLPLALLVVAWWALFLVLVPTAWRQEQLRQG